MSQSERYRLQAVPRVAGALVILLGGLTVGGWLFDIDTLKSVWPGLVSMKPNTAMCLILAGASLLLQTGPQPTSPGYQLWARILAGLVMGVALLTLAEYAFDLELGLDQWLFRESAQEAGLSFPGRMSPASGLGFVLLGGALMTLDLSGRRGAIWPAQYLALAATAVTLLAFIVYFYGVETPEQLARYVSIALHTVAGLFVLCLGILFARPHRGIMGVFTSAQLGGLVARRILPAALVAPLALGWFQVMAERRALYGLGFGTALFSAAIVVIFTVLIVWAAGALNQAESALNVSRENLRALAARLQAVREEERTHLAREIHDVLAQELTRLKMDLVWLTRRLERSPDSTPQQLLREKLQGMLALADTSIGSVQRISTELRPVVLDTLGLPAAIEWQAQDFQTRTGIVCHANVQETGPTDREVATALFRILQESLTNIARHAGASRVDIQLSIERGLICLTVRDNGRGLDPAHLSDPRSLGLLGMRERASLLGGNCQIGNGPAGGTTVQAWLPLAPASMPSTA